MIENPITDESYHSNATTGKQRIEFVDLAKGICILLVVLTHMGFTHDFPVLKAIRVPLYFVLSGLFFKDYGCFLNFTVKKINRIFIPFVFFFLIVYIPCVVLEPERMFIELIRPFNEPHILNEPIWFLIALFWVNLLYCTISLNIKKVVWQTVFVVSIGIVGYYVSSIDLYLPLFFSSSLSALPFFFLGVLLKKTPLLFHSRHERLIHAIVLPLTVLAIIYCCWIDTPNISFINNHNSSNRLLAYVVSSILIIGMLDLCKIVGWLPVISYFGRYSIIVLGVHTLVFRHVYQPISSSTGYLSSDVEMLAFTLTGCLLAIPLCKRLFPKLTAQEDLFKK